MKYLLLSIFLVASVNDTIFANNGNEKNVEINEVNIAKKWIFKDIINTKLSKEELEENKSLMEGFSLQFNKDKTCVTSFILDLDGTWKLDTSKKLVITTDRKGKNTWHIHSLTETKIIVSRNDAEQKIILVVE